MRSRLLKVCGMTYPEQVQALDEMKTVDMIGFIFYSQSKRCLTEIPPPTKNLIRVGVFVNETPEEIIRAIESCTLNVVQLHGDESPKDCSRLKKLLQKEKLEETRIMKAFGIGRDVDFRDMEAYEGIVDYFLFDTQTNSYGGSGKKFEWELLKDYRLESPFLLSGGINPFLIEELKQFYHPKCIGIDINSGFEIEPGNKNIELINEFGLKMK